MGHPFPRFITKTQRARFAASFVAEGDGCWEWLGARKDEYGSMRLDGRQIGAHRVAWVLGNDKEIPDGLEIDHLCRNTLCVNPAHLEPVTKSENLRRRWRGLE